VGLRGVLRGRCDLQQRLFPIPERVAAAPGRGVVDPEGAPLAEPSSAQLAGVLRGASMRPGSAARDTGGKGSGQGIREEIDGGS
jgi:hypothetical protein